MFVVKTEDSFGFCFWAQLQAAVYSLYLCVSLKRSLSSVRPLSFLLLQTLSGGRTLMVVTADSLIAV